MQSITLDHVAPQLRDGLLKSLGGDTTDGYVVVSAPAHPVALEGVLAAAGGEQVASVWASADGREYAGFGVAAEVQADSEERFARAEREVSQILGRVQKLDPTAPAPRMFGGFSFRSGRTESALWTGFGEAHFVLPRISCHRDDSGGWVSLTVRHDELKQPAVVQELVQRTAAWLGRLGRGNGTDGVSSVAFQVSDEPGLDEWTRLVREIQGEIQAGHFEKAVLARRAIYELRPPPSPREVLERLRHSAPDCTRFAVQRQGHVFLGATPEWLIRKRGRHIETEAMAGSISRGDGDAEQRLLGSAKDLDEHRLVLEEVVRVLKPLCVELSVPEGPQIRQLRDLLHLHTPVTGQLVSDHHVLDLVGRLHPTPAVGGVPRDAALAWLGEHEQESRGWYASPVGWVDAAGDGEFVVALRSALMIDNVAHLYAGAGIVRDSNPALEYEETQLKLASMVRALGVA